MPSIIHNGLVRRYSVRVPLDWPRYVMDPFGGPMAVWVMLTGGSPIQEFADTVRIEDLFRGLNMDNWGADPTFAGPQPALLTPPHLVAIFLDQTNPEGDVFPGDGKSFNSGGLAAFSAKLWDVDDVGAIDRIVGDVIAQFDGAIANLTGGAVTVAINRDRIFGVGFSDGGFMAFRQLAESVRGNLAYPLRGVFSAAGPIGGWALNWTYPVAAFPLGRFSASGVAETSAPAAPAGGATAARKAVFVVHGRDDTTVSPLGTPTDSVLVPIDSLQDGQQAGQADRIGWNHAEDKPLLPDGVAGLSAGDGHSVGSSNWWTFYASVNAWADGLEGVFIAFPAVLPGPLPIPPGVGQAERSGADWRVRLWSVANHSHRWPTRASGRFEGAIVAWLFFEQFAT